MNSLLFLDIGAPELMLILLFALSYPVLVIICLVNIIQSNFKDPANRLLWVLIVILAPFIGSVTYLLIGNKSKVIE